jgi:cell division protein FtsL
LRDLVLWATAVLFLLAALYTVTVRREVYEEARRIGALEQRLREQRRRNENAALRRETLASPAALLERARAMGLVEEEGARGPAGGKAR